MSSPLIFYNLYELFHLERGKTLWQVVQVLFKAFSFVQQSDSTLNLPKTTKKIFLTTNSLLEMIGHEIFFLEIVFWSRLFYKNI